MKQTELATELKLNKSTISRYVRAGCPLASREAALGWIRNYVSSHGGGWHHRGKTNTADRAAGALKQEREPSARDLFVRLAAEAHRIPDIAVRSGLRDVDVAAVLPDAFMDLVFLLGGGIADQAFDLDYPEATEPDYGELASTHKLGNPNPARTHEMLECFATVFDTVYQQETANV